MSAACTICPPAAALEVRVVRVRKTPGATPKRYVEYRDTGLHRPVTEVPA